MIPKIIHYCWYGDKKMGKREEMCLKSWKEMCPDYKIKCWNEENTEFNLSTYLKEAYEAKKYAFVTDYMRLYILYTFGGFYMDTDVELLKSLDPFRKCHAFTGCQEENVCVTGIIGAEAGNPWVEKLLSYYDKKHFLDKETGNYDLTPNTEFITEYTKKYYGWNFLEKKFYVNGILEIYPFDYFCCKDWETGYIITTSRSVSIHHFSGSWVENDNRTRRYEIKKCIKLILIKIFGYTRYRKILMKVRKNNES